MDTSNNGLPFGISRGSGPSSAKRLRSSSPVGPSSPPPPHSTLFPRRPPSALDNLDRTTPHPPPALPRWDNNNLKPPGRDEPTGAASLLSQALEKQSTLMVRSNLGQNDNDRDDSASDTTSERPESILDGAGGLAKADPDSLHRQLTSSSPAAAAAAAAAAAGGPAGLFPPGLEALYRQAGFPFMGLPPGGPPTSSSLGSSGSGPNSSLPSLSPTVPQVGLQSHAGNPNSKRFHLPTF